MKHRIKGRRLGRSPSHLAALKRTMACQLFAHERIQTTLSKAKELRPFAERLITIARRGAGHLETASAESDPERARVARAKALYARRRLKQLLGVGGKKKRPQRGGEDQIEARGHGTGFVVIKDEKINVVGKLLNEIGPRFADRPGGYTRIVRQAPRRLRDAAPLAIIELLSASEQGTPAPAPRPEVRDA